MSTRDPKKSLFNKIWSISIHLCNYVFFKEIVETVVLKWWFEGVELSLVAFLMSSFWTVWQDLLFYPSIGPPIPVISWVLFSNHN